MSKAFQIDARDNVATLIERGEGLVALLGAGVGDLNLSAPVDAGHKVALRAIAAGDPVIKYGVSIGTASAHIERGAWVHLHNLKSDYDERSATLDLHSGAPTDTLSAYE